MNYDIVIVGAGPAGISMAAEAVHAGIHPEKILIIEKATEHSFSIKKYYPDNKLVTANYKGFEAKCIGVMCIPDLNKHETISYLDQAIEENGLKVNYSETVWKIHQNDDFTFIIYTDKGEYNAKVITIAIGILGKPNKPTYKLPLSLKNTTLFDITSTEISNAKVLVVGGGDSASEYAQYLTQAGNTVTLSYRKDKFTRMNSINRISLEALASRGEVALYLNSDISEVQDLSGKPKVVFTDREPEEFDFVVYALGGSTPVNFLKSIGIDFDGQDPVLKEHHETSVRGLFLLGDLTAGTKGGSIIWAFNSSRTVINRICDEYFPNCGIKD